MTSTWNNITNGLHAAVYDSYTAKSSRQRRKREVVEVMADVVKCAQEAGVRDRIKIMIGGAPVSEDFCLKIGADVYTPDAASAADAAAQLCASK